MSSEKSPLTCFWKIPGQVHHPGLLLTYAGGVGSHSLPLQVTPALNINQQGGLTDEETTEVEVRFVQIDERVRGFAYQQERDCDVVLGD